MQQKKQLIRKRLVQILLANGILLSTQSAFAEDAVHYEIDKAPAKLTQPEVTAEDAVQAEKIKARLAEIAAEAKAAAKQANGYYVERKSYGTGRETEPPRYVKQLNKTWLGEYDTFADIDWLDVGLEHRFRYESRDNDFRRARDSIDEPFLHRTRAYVAVKNILDPLRFTLEVSDARRNHSQFTREDDTRDINYAEPLQAYLELYFKQTPLGKDDLGNDRPISVKAGRMAFEQLDRRLIARNEWRNSTNTFQGVRANIGQQKNDWSLELLALKPVQRFTTELDEVDHSQDFYGVIGDWRRWSEYVTISPYYLALKQDGGKVKFDANGKAALANTKIDREIHTAGVRAYGVVGKSGWDYDVNYAKQWGEQERRANNGNFIADLDHDAYAYNLEAGYTFNHAWKPRLSASYGFASGDKNQTDTGNERFERLFGFARPWSNNDYFQMENISAPKVRAEFEPQLSWLPGLKVDTGYSWYRLDSDRDRWNSANLRDATGRSGKDVGEEVDVRARFPVNKYVSANIGYAHFWAGDFTKTTSQLIDAERREDSDFLYVELTVGAF